MNEKYHYPGFKRDEFEDHLDSEDPSEDHVEDVHGVVKQMRLSMVLHGVEIRITCNVQWFTLTLQTITTRETFTYAHISHILTESIIE